MTWRPARPRRQPGRRGTTVSSTAPSLSRTGLEDAAPGMQRRPRVPPDTDELRGRKGLPLEGTGDALALDRPERAGLAVRPAGRAAVAADREGERPVLHHRPISGRG